ncbi:hypothetical protein Q4551_12060 [Oceanobacter sp. 5_MG-2023]|uniref:hypothetical protein n=1 Tax=Oceanobacter sp. 5_MG-2023 TaxID=3062645 RepID=UPI0026E40EE9|nr:hypothetical protein [Oceanobacter sp. 5_MG-2023]MDO6683025.1 hypothetical protein [Oceanobacter sp. 5_MG-2023]
MLRLFQLCLLLGVYVVSPAVLSHDVNMATFQVRYVESQGWVYEVMTPLYNLDRSLHMTHPDAPDADFDSVAYKESVVAYIKQGFDMSVSDAQAAPDSGDLAVSLGRGRIKLDNHLSVLLFEIKGMPTDVSKLAFHISSMTEYRPAKNVFRVIHGEHIQRYWLTPGNHYAGAITLL